MENTNTNQTETTRVEVKSKKARSSKARKVRGRAAPKPRATALEFSPEPDKAGWRYAEGRAGRFCIGASRHHGTEFGLYYKTPEMSRFKFVAGFSDEASAKAAAEEANTRPEPSTVSLER